MLFEKIQPEPTFIKKIGIGTGPGADLKMAAPGGSGSATLFYFQTTYYPLDSDPHLDTDVKTKKTNLLFSR